MKLVPGPDFPTGGYIYGREGIEQAYKTGRGSFQVRAKAAIEQRGKDRQDIVVTELPYQVNKARLIEHIAGLIQNKKSKASPTCATKRPRRHAHRHRSEARRRAANHPEQPFQAHADAGILRHDPAGDRRRAAARAGPAPDCCACSSNTAWTWCAAARSTNCAKPKSASTFCSATRSRSIYLDDVIRVIRGSSSRANARENLHEFFTNKTVKISRDGKSEKHEGVKLVARSTPSPEIAEVAKRLGLSFTPD
jgi:DNA gyrase subunit A